MSWKFLTMAALTVVAVMNPVKSHAASEGCVIAAEITVEAVCAGAMAKCVTADGVACRVALACQDAATKEVAKTATAEGCTYVVKKVGPKITILIESAREKLSKMSDTQKSLDQVEGRCKNHLCIPEVWRRLPRAGVEIGNRLQGDRA